MTIVKGRLAAVFTALALALGISLVAASPASASYATCPAGQTCVYTGFNGGGSQLALPFSTFDPPYTCWDFGGSWNNNIESAKTDYGNLYGIDVWTGQGCTGSRYRVPPKSQGNFTGGFVNTISSFQITPN